MNKFKILSLLTLLNLFLVINAVQNVEVLLHATFELSQEINRLQYVDKSDVNTLYQLVEQHYPEFAAIKTKYMAIVKGVGENMTYGSFSHVSISLELPDHVKYSHFCKECNQLSQKYMILGETSCSVS